MAGGQERNRNPIQLLVNYWEIRPSAMVARLDELLSSGITQLATFVPWQALEADISHQFMRLLHAVTERKMSIALIVTPDVGIHYPFSGLPKDVVGRTDNAVQHYHKGPVTVQLAPNHFVLPSLIAPEFTKRYYSFVARIDNLLSELERSLARPIPHVTLLLSGSFWKYYRSPSASAARPFSGPAGDYSPQAAIQFRQRLEDFYSQAEFNDPTPLSANRWKTQALEPVNRRWFYQQSEAVFRNRTLAFARKKTTTAQLREIELFTPEADPSLHYSYFLQTISGRDMDFHRLSSLVDEAASFGSMGGLRPAPPCVHWSALGGFRNLSDQEKQFLILKSLLLMGGAGGSVLIDEEEWLSFSRGFRAKADAFARSISHGELRARSQALYLVPHLWSGPTTFWEMISRRLGHGGHGALRIASADRALQDPDARLLFVDPGVIITRELLHQLSEWAGRPDRSGGTRTVVLPRSTLYTESARSQLEVMAAGSKRIEMNLGIAYRVHPLGEGRLVVYDIPEAAILSEQDSPEWGSFLGSILSLAEVGQVCEVSDSRIHLIPLERADGGIGLFVLNGTHRQISIDLFFPVAVSVSDLAVEVSAAQRRANPAGNLAPDLERTDVQSELPAEPLAGRPGRDGDDGKAPAAKRFSLDVPPCGILPLAVDRIGGSESLGEQRAADRLASLGRDNAASSAAQELPGLNLYEGPEETPPWS